MRMHTCVCVRVCVSTNNLCRSTGCGNEILSVVIRSVAIKIFFKGFIVVITAFVVCERYDSLLQSYTDKN